MLVDRCEACGYNGCVEAIPCVCHQQSAMTNDESTILLAYRLPILGYISLHLGLLLPPLVIPMEVWLIVRGWIPTVLLPVHVVLVVAAAALLWWCTYRSVLSFKCTNAGIEVVTAIRLGQSVSWGEVRAFRRTRLCLLRGIPILYICVLKCHAGLPLCLHLTKDVSDKLAALLRETSDARIIGFESARLGG